MKNILRINRNNISSFLDIKIIFLFAFLSGITSINSQVGDLDLRNRFNSIVFIKDSLIKKEVINGKEFEIYLKEPGNKNPKPFKYQSSGSGFIVAKERDVYLVSAEHVVKNLSGSASIAYRSSNGKMMNLRLKDLGKANWFFHPTADVAVRKIELNDSISNLLKGNELGALDYWHIDRVKKAPGRFDDIVVIGFPLGLGVSKDSISPISMNTRTSSDIVVLNRADNQKANYFYLLDDPSVSGFSGGPILFISEALLSRDKKTFLPGKTFVKGLVHGTLSDPKDRAGRFAAIVPGFVIVETIDLVPSFSGDYEFKYPDGSSWSKRKYVNGVPWTVYTNIGPDRQEQEKGTLKNGTGTLFTYDEKGKLLYVERYKNGIRESLSPAMTSEELKRFGNFNPVDENKK